MRPCYAVARSTSTASLFVPANGWAFIAEGTNLPELDNGYRPLSPAELADIIKNCPGGSSWLARKASGATIEIERD
jgi:hypothetical protein